MTAVALPAAVVEERPVWRGWLHTMAFFASIPGTVVLLSRSDRTCERVTALVYGLALMLGFGTSAAYHRLARTPRARRIMQRMDHSGIFVLIAGTCTPVCVLGLPARWGVPILCIVAVGAALGIVLKQFAFARFKYVEYALYPGLGWAVVAGMPAMVHSLTAPELILLVAGGLVYTLGIPVLMWNRPNPWPHTFGYHEIWHAATVLGGVCHFAVVSMLVS